VILFENGLATVAELKAALRLRLDPALRLQR
jgi:hypothetical protein